MEERNVAVVWRCSGGRDGEVICMGARNLRVVGTRVLVGWDSGWVMGGAEREMGEGGRRTGEGGY